MAQIAQDIANDRYKDLCAKLTDLTIQRELIDKDIAEIRKQIEAINITVPILHRVEDVVTKTLQPDKAPEKKTDG